MFYQYEEPRELTSNYPPIPVSHDYKSEWDHIGEQEE